MKKLIAIALLSVIVLAGCNGGNGDDEVNNDDNGTTTIVDNGDSGNEDNTDGTEDDDNLNSSSVTVCTQDFYGVETVTRIYEENGYVIKTFTTTTESAGDMTEQDIEDAREILEAQGVNIEMVGEYVIYSFERTVEQIGEDATIEDIIEELGAEGGSVSCT